MKNTVARKKKTRGLKSSILVYAVFIGITVTGLWLVSFIYPTVVNNFGLDNKKPAECRVIANELVIKRKTSGATSRKRSSPLYTVKILYEYRVAGQNYRSDTTYYKNIAGWDKERLERFVGHYPSGSIVPCLVDYDHPEHVIVHEGTWDEIRPHLVFAGFGLILLIWGGGGLALMMYDVFSPIKTRLRSERQVTAKGIPLAPPGNRIWAVAKSVATLSICILLAQGLPVPFSWLLYLFSAVALLAAVLSVARLFTPAVTVYSSEKNLHIGRSNTLSWTLTAGWLKPLRITLQLVSDKRTYDDDGDEKLDSEHRLLLVADIDIPELVAEGSATIAIPTDVQPSKRSTSEYYEWNVRVVAKLRWWPDMREHFPVKLVPAPTD
ncbi:MAG: DUF3592 domain-containing protein [Rickettsiales bacterium]|nr:DUF3592 domain-containing protein [Rickettsiales bacterium]